MSINAVRVSSIILLVVHLMLIISGFTLIFAPDYFLANEFKGYTGQKWEEFIKSDSKITSFFLLEATQMGLFMITLGVILIIITLFAYRKGDKWAWYLLLFSNTLGWGGPTVTNMPTKDMDVIMGVIIFLVLGYIGLAIGAKSIFKKK